MQSTVKFFFKYKVFAPQKVPCGPYHSIPHPSHPLLSIHHVPKFKERWQYTVYTVCKYICIHCISVHLYVYNLMLLMYLYWPAYLYIYYIIIFYIYTVSLYKQNKHLYVWQQNNPKKKRRLLGNLPSSRPWARRQSHTLAGPSSCRCRPKWCPHGCMGRRRMDSAWDFFETPKWRKWRNQK